VVPVLLLVGLVVAAWAVDTGGGGDVPRGVEVGGEAVGGLRRAAVADVVATVARRVEDGEVRVTTPDGGLRSRADRLGLHVDEAATVERALDADRRGWLGARVWGWVRGLFGARSSAVVADVDEGRLAEVLADGDPTDREEPTEPGLAWDPEAKRLVVEPGADGHGLDPAELGPDVGAAVAGGRPPFEVAAEAGPVPPRFDAAAAQRLLGEAEEATAAPLPVVAGDQQVDLAPEVVRPWLRARPEEDRLALAVDERHVAEALPGLLPEAGTPGVDAGLQVVGSGVVLTPDRPGTACCDDAAPGAVLAALRDPGVARPVALGLRPAPARFTADEVAGWGVTRPVASFTTYHAAGEARVTNIHRIADLLRGALIEPGGMFSVNGTIGPRTRAKGFVEAGVIEQGEFTTSVGGGISQFATTLFNAAFFAGLEFDEYQSHSIYISRYPYGREATLSYPAPDLELSNPSAYGILIWPTYTGSSITVTLWSTPTVTVEQTAQSEEQVGNCTRVTTERTRTALGSGGRRVDTVHATYRPAEGVDC
jgi:vancomycin resistance protein YoaR